MITTLFSLPGDTRLPYQSSNAESNADPLVRVICISRSADPNARVKDGNDYFFAKGEDNDVAAYVQLAGGAIIEMSDELPEPVIGLFDEVAP